MRRYLLIGMTISLVVSLAACGSSESGTTSTTAATTITAASGPTFAPTTTTVAMTSDAPQTGTRADTDLVYATRIRDGLAVRLDMHLPAEPDGAPIVVEGDEQLVELGMIVVKLHETDPLGLASGPETYVADRVSVRSWAELYGCTIRLARARASELGNDDPVVVLEGFSLFGGLAVQVGLFGETLDTRWEEFAAAGGPPRQFDCAVTDGSTHVDAVIGMGAPADVFVPIIEGTYGRTYQQEHDPEMQEFLASPIGSNPDLKVRLIHGTSDAIPAEYAEELAGELTGAGYDVEFVAFDGEHEMPPMDLHLTVLMEVLGRRNPAP